MNYTEKAISLMPPEFARELRSIDTSEIEEFRIRIGRRPAVVLQGKERMPSSMIVRKKDINRIIEKATGASYHMAEHSINEGYINYSGLRIGVCGRVNMQKDGIHSMGKINSLAIRIPAEHKGICSELFSNYFAKSFESTLIVSPPGGGKTTVLREMCRMLSAKAYRVGVVDERNELLADDGDAGFDLGEHSDVISCVPKAFGSMMLLRSMNPEIIAMDEITKAEDIEAIAQLAGCGVKVLATAHASGIEDLKTRLLYRQLLDLDVFKFLLKIQGQGRNRIYKAERIMK